MITLTQLEYIVAVERHGSFRQAAKSCFVTQPTLSMQIQKLEEELGVLIFDRSEQPIRATPIGRRVIEQAAVVLTQTQRITAIIDETKETLEGELRLGVIPTMAPYMLPLFLPVFANDFPRLRLHVEESKTDDIVIALRRGHLDVGLLATPLDEALIDEHPIFVEPFYVYAAESSELASRAEISEADLAGERMLLLTEGHCLRTQMEQVCGARDAELHREGGSLDFESGSIETLCRLVERGLGYTVIPHLARSSTATRAGKVIPFTAPEPGREVSLCVHASFARRAVLERLTRTIRDSLPRELRKPRANLQTIRVR